MSAIQVNESNFQSVVMDSGKPVLIDFWAQWCGPCRMQSPVVENVAQTVGDAAVVAKLNVDESPEIAAQFSVMSIPTLICIKNGKEVGRRVGVSSKEALLDMIGSVGP